MEKKYIPVAIKNLRELNSRRAAADNLRERIRDMEEDAASVRGSTMSTVPVKGGGNRTEEWLVNYMQRKDQLKKRLRETEKMIDITERVLDSMDPKKQRVLELFYINRPYGYLWKLMDEMGYSRTAVYRIKDEALEEFCRKMYG